MTEWIITSSLLIAIVLLGIANLCYWQLTA